MKKVIFTIAIMFTLATIVSAQSGNPLVNTDGPGDLNATISGGTGSATIVNDPSNDNVPVNQNISPYKKALNDALSAMQSRNRQAASAALEKAADLTDDMMDLIEVADLASSIGAENLKTRVLNRSSTRAADSFDYIVLAGAYSRLNADVQDVKALVDIAGERAETSEDLNWVGHAYLGIKGDARNQDANLAAAKSAFQKAARTAEDAYDLMDAGDGFRMIGMEKEAAKVLENARKQADDTWSMLEVAKTVSRLNNVPSEYSSLEPMKMLEAASRLSESEDEAAEINRLKSKAQQRNLRSGDKRGFFSWLFGSSDYSGRQYNPYSDAISFYNFDDSAVMSGYCYGFSYISASAFRYARWKPYSSKPSSRKAKKSLWKILRGRTRSIGGFNSFVDFTRHYEEISRDACRRTQYAMAISPSMLWKELKLLIGRDQTKVLDDIKKGIRKKGYFILGLKTADFMAQHAVVAYSVQEYGSQATVMIYDCNRGAKPMSISYNKSTKTISYSSYEKWFDLSQSRSIIGRFAGWLANLF